MERRDFLKNMAIASAGLSLPNLYGFVNIREHQNGSLLIAQRQTTLDVIANVDVLVVGATTAGIAAAISAAKKGASVYVVGAAPYLGTDICGTLRLWDVAKGKTTPFAERLLQQGKAPYPAVVKRALQQELLDHNIPFLLSTYVGGVVLDEDHKMGGLVLANRSGEQVIRTNVVIDATETALVARLNGNGFKKQSRQKAEYRFTVIGNTPKENLKHKTLPPLVFHGKSYAATEYSFTRKNAVQDFGELQALEQSIRDQTWDAEQVDASDMLFEIPNVNIVGKNASPVRFQDSGALPFSVLQPAGSERLFLLNAYADVSVPDKEKMMLPGNMIALGQRLGEHAAIVAQKNTPKALAHIRERTGRFQTGSQAKVYNRRMRPVHQVEKITIDSERIPLAGTFDNVVVGGGTAGACAAISSARYGSKTAVIEYLHGLGGMGTLGLIGRYWVGYREGFTKEIDQGVRSMAPAAHPRQKKRKADWVKDWKMEWYRKEIQKPGGVVWFGAIACGAVVEGKTVKGVVLATPYGKQAVMAKNLIDATGSADIAIAAGAPFEFIHADSVAVQGSGLPKADPDDHYNNTDYTFTDDADVIDVTRTFVAGNAKYRNVYDIGKLPQTRERRRITGDYRVTAMDMANGRNYDDTISYHYSSFDTHGYTIDPYFIIKPPAGSTVDMHVNVPLRALLPKGIDNIIVTGLGASADRDAMPVIRMQPCLQNQGYAVGYLASVAQKENVSFREIDFGTVRSELVRKGTLPAKTETDQDIFPPSDQQIREAAKAVVNDFDQLEVILWDRERGLKILRKEFDSSEDADLKAKWAVILGFYGYEEASAVLTAEIKKYADWDAGWNFRGMHQFGMSASYLDAMIMSLGKTRSKTGFREMKRLSEKLTSESELSHFRAIAEACADIKAPGCAALLHQLLTMPGIGGHAVNSLHQAVFTTKEDTNDNTTRNQSLKELFLARALYICGDHHDIGRKTLMQYANDLHGLYNIHAMDVLEKYG